MSKLGQIGSDDRVWYLGPGGAFLAEYLTPKAQSPGFKYYLDVQTVVQYGAVDKVLELMFGERSAWIGGVSSGTISVNAPALFGGDSGQGGVVGDVIVLDGNPTQLPPAQQEALAGFTLPGWRDVLSLYFKNFLWSTLSPYFKSPWVRTERLLAGWDTDTPWYPEKIAIPRYKTTGMSLEFWDYKWFPEGVDDINWELPTVDLTDWTTNQDVGSVPFVSNTAGFPVETTVGDDTHHPVTMWYRYNFTQSVTQDVSLTFSTAFPMTVWLNGDKLFDLPSGTSNTIIPKAHILSGANNVIAIKTGGGTPGNPAYKTYAKIAANFIGFPTGIYYSIPDYIEEARVRISAYYGVPYELDLTSAPTYPPYPPSISPNFLRVGDHSNSPQSMGSEATTSVAGVDPVINTVGFVSGIIVILDMNPAHIIYQCLTDPARGMGYPRADLSDVNFKAGADTLFDEGFGLSLVWDQQITIEAFVKLILDHINGVLRLNLETGLFELKLIRDDVDVEDMLVMDADNCDVTSFHRQSWGEIFNELTVKYTDDDQNETSLTVHNLSALQSQGGTVPTVRDYPGIRDPQLAARVGERDINLISLPLAKVSLTASRVMFTMGEGDAFVLNYAPENIDNVVFRILKINKGTLLDPSIKVEAIEDAFALPDQSYLEYQPSTSNDPTQASIHKVSRSKVVEAPYADIVKLLTADQITALGANFAFGQTMASYGGNGYALNYTNWASDTGLLADYVSTNIENFSTSMILVDAVGKLDTTMTFEKDIDFSNVDNSYYAYLGDECVQLINLDLMTGIGEVKRACFDTIPADHPAGTMLIFNATPGVDLTVRSEDDSVYYKLLPRTTNAELPLAYADADLITFVNRAYRPYNMANVKMNGVYYADSVDGDLLLEWANRNRILQTTGAVLGFLDGNVTPETGVTYTFNFINTETMLTTLTVDGITGVSHTFTESELSGIGENMILEISSVRDGVESYQKYEIPFINYNSVSRVTENDVQRITEEGIPRILE